MRAAPAARAVLDQADKRWPKRAKGSDGILPSRAHTKANPNSDHEPNAQGLCRAVDLTHDPDGGPDCRQFFTALVASRDRRVKYAIHAGKMVRSYAKGSTPAWAVTRYTGSNPHDHHCHVSLVDTPGTLADTSPWPYLSGDKPAPKPKPKPKPRPVLKEGAHGPAVKTVQMAVRVKVDGDFGPKTAAGVRKFQKAHGLAVDGIVGPKTWAAIDKHLKG